MKKLLVTMFIIVFALTVVGLAAAQEDEKKVKVKESKEMKVATEKEIIAFKEKINAKIEKMKADGASEKEIEEFIKQAKMKFKSHYKMEKSSCKDSEMAEMKKKISMKIEQMKADGASEEEIQEVITKFKEEMKKMEYDKQKTKVKKEKVAKKTS